MDKLQQAIQKAIEGGYELKQNNSFFSDPKDLSKIGIYTHIVVLDPLFWQSLGKSLGWDKLVKVIDGKEWNVGKYGLLPEFVWKGEWHRFIDHLAEGKTAESYFNDLLK